MERDWFKKRSYRHFDYPVGKAFAEKAQDPAYVARHPFSPLIRFETTEKRYKKCEERISNGPLVRKVITKCRPICYASHRDACIFSWYARVLGDKLEDRYRDCSLSDCIIAYRALGRSNYDFAAEVHRFARQCTPVSILAFDIKSFFDHLDHGLLKENIKHLLDTSELPKDWYQVYKAVTRFRLIDRSDIFKHKKFRPDSGFPKPQRIASIREILAADIRVRANPEVSLGKRRGIPQGTPISAVLSNLYMLDFDIDICSLCDPVGALYRRYSDDILVVCKPSDVQMIKQEIEQKIATQKLEIQSSKTGEWQFDPNGRLNDGQSEPQYLGFLLAADGAAIREQTLSRQWRKLKRAIKSAERAAVTRANRGNPSQIYTKKLRKRFTYLNVWNGSRMRTVRNFPSYARHSATVFDHDQKILRQVRKFERRADQLIRRLKGNGNT